MCIREREDELGWAAESRCRGSPLVRAKHPLTEASESLRQRSTQPGSLGREVGQKGKEAYPDLELCCLDSASGSSYQSHLLRDLSR